MKMIAIVLALFVLAGCVILPLGPHSGYHASPHYAPPPYGHSSYGHDAPRYHGHEAPGPGYYERGDYR